MPITYHGAEVSKQSTLGLLQLLLRFRLQEERSLTGPGIGGRLQFNLVLRHDLLHDLSRRDRLAILVRGSNLSRREAERIGEEMLLRLLKTQHIVVEGNKTRPHLVLH